MKTGRANVRLMQAVEAMQIELAKMSGQLAEMNQRLQKLEKLNKASALPADGEGKDKQYAKSN